MQHQLYYYPANANLAPHILLEEAGCEHELVLVDRRSDQQKSAEYLRLNPNGRIPVLVSGELVLFEAAAICLYLADLYPGARLAPALGTPQRAHFYKWLTFLTNTVQPAYMAWWAERLASPPSALPGVRRCVRAVAARPATQRACAAEAIELRFA